MQFMELEGLTVSHLNAHPGAAKYDLTLYLTDAGDEIWLEVEYCTDLFDDETIRPDGQAIIQTAAGGNRGRSEGSRSVSCRC